MVTEKKNNTQEYYVIDFLHIVRTVWRRIWAVILVGVIGAVIGFSYSAFLIPPKYSSSIMLYVNNSSFSLGSSNFSISSSDLTAAQSLVNTYMVILENKTTLDQVIDKTGLDYTYLDLYEMIDSEAVDETEILRVTVTTEDPYESEKIANTIAVVLPERISEIIEGSSMKVVDLGFVNNNKVSPSITRYTEVGLLLGVLVSLIVLIVIALMDDTIHDEEYVHNTYNYPILAKVPNLLGSSEKRYGYYYRKNSSK